MKTALFRNWSRAPMLVLGAGALVGAWLCGGCLADEPVNPVSGLRVDVRGSDTVANGRAYRSDDGYTVRFERALLGFGALQAERDLASPRGPAAPRYDDSQLDPERSCNVPIEDSLLFGSSWKLMPATLLDLARNEELPPVRIWSIRSTGCPRYALSVAASVGTAPSMFDSPDPEYAPPAPHRNPSYRAEDYADIGDLWPTIALRAVAEGEGKRVSLDLLVEGFFEIQECGRGEGSPGLGYRSGEYTSTKLVFEAERLFADDTDDPAANRVAPFVRADADGDGVVTAEELTKVPARRPLTLARPPDGFGGPPGEVAVRDLLDVLVYRMTYAFRDETLGRCTVRFNPSFTSTSVEDAPDGAAPDGSASDGSAPDGSAPDGSAPDGAVPDAGQDPVVDDLRRPQKIARPAAPRRAVPVVAPPSPSPPTSPPAPPSPAPSAAR